MDVCQAYEGWVDTNAMNLDQMLLTIRALVVCDLAAAGCADAQTVSVVESAVSGRRWWVEEWPEGAPYLAGQVAQDVQETLAEVYGRWPICPLHGEDGLHHELTISPELGEDPQWTCAEYGVTLAALGDLDGWVAPVR